jgi:hypothetical protein
MIVACAAPIGLSSTTPADYTMPQRAKIGYVSKVAEHPVHLHQGLTAFGNFERDLDVSWHLNQFIFSSLSESLKNQYGYELIDLSEYPNAEHILASENLFHKENSSFVVSDLELMTFLKSIGRPDLDGLILVQSNKIFYNTNLERIKPSLGRQGDHGIASGQPYVQGVVYRSSLGLTAITINPKIHYSTWKYIGMFNELVHPQPNDPENLSPDELSQYEKEVKNIIAIKIADFVGELPAEKVD